MILKTPRYQGCLLTFILIYIVMTLLDMYEAAYIHYVNSRQQSSDEMTILAQYAREQLALKDDQVLPFVLHVNYKSIDITNYDAACRFLEWYYINYLVEKKGPVLYSICIRQRPTVDFAAVAIQPSKVIDNYGSSKAVPCASSEADYWSLYTNGVDGSKTFIADCRDQPTAEALHELLQAFALKRLR